MRHGSQIDPPNRFEGMRAERDWEQLEWDQEYRRQVERREIQYLKDESKSIVSQNRSPDIPFRFSLNPYRGCAHGCSYCYARPTHEYLGLNAGLDFETKIIVKHDAPRLFREFLARRSWVPEPISFSGVTDCYQPAEREFRLTRQCLEVALECRQPVSIITKNALVLRDLDLLQAMAKLRLVHVYVSLTTLEPQLARDMEPRTSIPSARLRAVETLAAAGVPVGVMMAPVVPGLTDAEIPAVLKAAAAAGAEAANYVMLRLPLTVQAVFREWLQRARPLQAEKVLGLLRDARDGQLNSAAFGERMRGRGERAEQIGQMFRLFKQQLQLADALPRQDASQFQPPKPQSGQLRLF
ncbi:PA0069 family radical SAM protein [Roseimaritima ulvae]|uniref:Radical SAM superfamily protein n=1 Tax=Roseimaritima ulvae TaxID=980254 RepID=A0A5B9R4Q2_9BACT|nr:PA0069 family radical SAM protein [Roseimaritima ulvae]QEG41451.1 Radical SAM superfamily protein [Roseimaritima ulvae]